MKDHLKWKEKSIKTLYSCRVFNVEERSCISPENKDASFTVLNCPDWAIVIPVLKTKEGRNFVMVWQWRHGEKALSLEFPGGVCEKGEDEYTAAKRELLEETGYIPGNLIKLGEFNPNPAIMSNKVHLFLAEDLTLSGRQTLDEDEFVDVQITPEIEVLKGMGRAPYIHALMGTALAMYLLVGR